MHCTSGWGLAIGDWQCPQVQSSNPLIRNIDGDLIP